MINKHLVLGKINTLRIDRMTEPGLYLMSEDEKDVLLPKAYFKEGMKVGYLPDIQLTHLERQSFKELGNDDFRTRVVIYNAVRNQERWDSFFVGPEEQPSKVMAA